MFTLSCKDFTIHAHLSTYCLNSWFAANVKTETLPIHSSPEIFEPRSNMSRESRQNILYWLRYHRDTFCARSDHYEWFLMVLWKLTNSFDHLFYLPSPLCTYNFLRCRVRHAMWVSSELLEVFRNEILATCQLGRKTWILKLSLFLNLWIHK